jgi:hypothetical protein
MNSSIYCSASFFTEMTMMVTWKSTLYNDIVLRYARTKECLILGTRGQRKAARSEYAWAGSMGGLVNLLFLGIFFTKRKPLHHGKVDGATRLRCNREINIGPRKNLEHTPLRVSCNHRVSIRRGI